MTTLTRGRSRQTIQMAWLVVAVAGTIIYAAGPISRWGTLQTSCHMDSACLQVQLDSVAAATLNQHGISLAAYAVYTALDLTAVWLLWYGLAALIIWRKPEDRGAVLAAFFLILFPLYAVALWIPSSAAPFWLGDVFLPLLLLFGLLFPDGHFAPRWTRWLAVAIVLFFVAVSFPLPAALDTILIVSILPLLLGVVVAQIQRYRSVSSWRERQQTKWGVFGLAVAILGVITLDLVTLLPSFPTGDGSLVTALINSTGIAVLISAIPVSIGIAVLHNRLWDIDRVINRALVYGVLTLTLGAIYVGAVIGLQALFRVLTGQQSDLAIALSTLAIAVLFNPVRRRIQDVIARAFYRRRYDAAQVLAAFSAACRDQTDLEQLRAGLLRAVEETMQPGYASLWLADPAPGRKT